MTGVQTCALPIYIQDGVVQVRFYQDEKVPPKTHIHQFDWVALSKGLGTPVGQEIDPNFHAWAGNPFLNNSLAMDGNNITDVNLLNVTTLIVGSANITNLITNGVNISNISNEYVPYTGATKDVDLGANELKFGTSGIYGRTVPNAMILDGHDNIWFTINSAAPKMFFDGLTWSPIADGALDLGTTSYAFGTAYINTIDLGTNTITDTDFTGDWNFNGDVNIVGNANITSDGNAHFNNATLGGIYYYSTEGACDLSLAKSTCSNSSGRYLIE